LLILIRAVASFSGIPIPKEGQIQSRNKTQQPVRATVEPGFLQARNSPRLCFAEYEPPLDRKIGTLDGLWFLSLHDGVDRSTLWPCDGG
jgi:hypothetical protein